jgi:hypothetical protein
MVTDPYARFFGSQPGGQVFQQLMSNGLQGALSGQTFNTAPAAQFSNLVKSAQEQTQTTPSQTTSPQTATTSSSGTVPYDFIGPLSPGQTRAPAPTGTTDTSGSTGETSGTYTPTGDPLADYLHQAVSQSLGANAFASKVMNDKDMYAELFPGVPADQLPVGASLTDQINTLYKTLSDEHNLTQLHDSLIDAANQGYTLKDDASAYIQGKDQYLNQIDQMLTNAETSAVNNPMNTDPWYAQTMQNYLTYLTTLRGRTTQRYVDYVNTTVNAQNAKIQTLQNDYNTAAAQVQTLFNTDSQITVQQYNETKQTLVDMYNNLAQQGTLTDASSKEYWDAIKAQYDALNTINKYTSVDATKLKLVQTQVSTAKTLEQALSDPILNGNNISPSVIAQQYAQSQMSKQKAALSHDPTSFSGLYNATQTEVGKISAQIQSLQSQYQTTQDPQTLQDIQTWSDILAAFKPFDNVYNQALKDYIGGTSAYTSSAGMPVAATPSKVTDIQNALSDMAQAIANGSVKTYEEWSSKRAGAFWHTTKANYYNKIDPSILKLLFNTALARVHEYSYDQQSGGSSKISLSFKDMTAAQIADSIYYSIPGGGIPGASSAVDLSQYDTTAASNPAININFNSTDNTGQ